MTHADLQSLQQRVKFDAPSMAACLGIDYEQYRRYYYGKTPIPAAVERAALALEAFERECDAAREAETEDLLRRQYPGGIPTARKRQG